MTAEPPEVRIGSVRVARTFRLGRHGELYPVASGGPAWTAGDNTATCRRQHADEVPSPRCGCGFYGTAP